MKEAFLSFISKHRLISRGERVLVAFSGGADSTCLLHLLSRSGFEVAAAHLHHSQRPEGDADVDHCRSVCEKLGVAFYSGKADVPGVAKVHKIGIEEAGRKLRYEFFQMMAARGYQKVATGHTLDDNLESMLLHLARGTGMRGLAGIPVRRGNVIRPILPFSREQTHAYCTELGLTYVSDSYNEDESYARNLVRNQVVKRLKEVNSSVAEHAFTTARILTEENELLDSLAASHLQASEIPPQHPLAFIERTLTTSWSDMEDLPTALLRRCIRLAAGLYGGSLDFDQTQAIAEAIQSGGKTSHTAEGAAVSVSVGDGRWRVTRTETAQPFREMLTIDGDTIADDLGWSLAAWRGDSPATPLQSTFDGEKIKGDLYVRSLKKGDKIDPPGRGEAKLLADRLARAGIPQEVRQRLPVVCDMLGPVWAPVIGPDKRCAATQQTANPISLRLSEIEEPSGTPGAV